jgi:flagellar biosynthesis chaperone FliJ
MEESQKYPLDQLVAIKQKRLEEAERVLAEKKSILAQEEQKLAALEKKTGRSQRTLQRKIDSVPRKARRRNRNRQNPADEAVPKTRD